MFPCTRLLLGGRYLFCWVENRSFFQNFSYGASLGCHLAVTWVKTLINKKKKRRHGHDCSRKSERYIHSHNYCNSKGCRFITFLNISTLFKIKDVRDVKPEGTERLSLFSNLVQSFPYSLQAKAKQILSRKPFLAPMGTWNRK